MSVKPDNHLGTPESKVS